MRYEGMSLFGAVVSVIFLVLFYTFSYIIVRRRYHDSATQRLFFWGLTLKFVGGLAFAMVYQFYYGGGDTFRYFANATTLVDKFYEDPIQYLTLLTKSSLEAKDLASLSGTTNMLDAYTTYLTVRVASLIGIFTGQFFLVSTFCFAFLSYIGIWGLYRTAYRMYPNYGKYIAIAVLFIPSVYFWSSSIMKDTLVMGFLGLLVYLSYRLLILKEFRLLYIALFFVSLWILFNVKVYVIISFLPALFLWLVFENSRQIRSKKIKALVKPLSAFFVIGMIAVGLPLISSVSEQYSLETALETAEETANYINRVSIEKGGAAYDLGNVSYTPLGLIRVFPQAVNVSLFRPYLWEVRNPVMLLAALEGTALLLITLYLFLRVGILSFFRTILKNPFALASLSFSIVFAFAVGFSTYNFGSLVRYKIPCLAFYGLVLAISYGEYKSSRFRQSVRGTQYPPQTL